MDNLSHSLAGVAAGLLLHRTLRPERTAQDQAARQRLLVVGCAIASNVPDLDILLTPLLPAPLGYLLHHRGHTHTVLYALPQALLVWAALWALWPAARRLLNASAPARLGLAAATALGLGLHLLMDYLNSYGIHPFHPLDSRWYYGDMVFILEPVFWVALGVPLCLLIRRSWLRAAWLGLLAAVLAYVAAGGFLHGSSLLGLYALGGALAILHFAHRRREPHAATGGSLALGAGVAVLVLFLLVQAAATAVARRDLQHLLSQIDASSRLKDSARTAFPANPLCWNFVSVETHEAADLYRLRRGVLSIAPGLKPVTSCPAVLAERSRQQPVSPALALLDNHEGSLAALRALHGENCHFRAWMRFARMPLVEDGVALDLRYSSEMRSNFTAMELAGFAGQACPTGVPQWAFPRADVLQAP